MSGIGKYFRLTLNSTTKQESSSGGCGCGKHFWRMWILMPQKKN